MEFSAIAALAAIYLIGISIVIWIGYDTDRNLKRRYSQATDEDVDKFMRDNAPLMDDLAGRKRDGD